MANGNFTKWHVAGLHALRSASEQGVAAGADLREKVDHQELEKLLVEYGDVAAQQQRVLTGFLQEFGAEPNGFKDRIMEGVSNGAAEMLEAAPDQDLRNLSAVAAAQSGLDYYGGAFKGQGALAEKLGHAHQAKTFLTMSAGCEALRDRLTKVGDVIRAKAAEEAPKPS